ncbi:MAG: DUF4423 domain-containing protein [Bacteriovoracaceae bacterium]
MLSIFDFSDYKSFLRNLMPSSGESRGLKSKLAQALGCQLSFVSLVLTQTHTHFSPEHGKGVCEFFKLTEDETNFFMLLLSKQRAGSKTLENFYDSQIKKILQDREAIKSRIKGSGEISKEDQALYYSEWYFTALHMILRSENKIDLMKVSDALGVPYEKINKAIDFFIRTGIIKIKDNRYIVQDIRFHIDENSAWLNLHHRNWRQKAIQNLDHKRKDDLNYTVVTSISEEVAKKIKHLLLEAIQKSEPLIKEAPDQTVYNLNIDFQKIY